jgi:uncharacterized protein (TIGR02996 family)
MPTHEGFWETIRDDPDDDAPRLVYADWLEDQGDADNLAHAELLRVQCRLARLDGVEEEFFDLQTREELLLREHGRRWLAELPTDGIDWRFRRGLPEHVSVPRFHVFADQAGDLLRHPVLTLSVREAKEFRRLVRSPEVARLRGLELHGGEVGDPLLAALASCPHVAGLRALGFEAMRVTGRGLADLVRSPHLRLLSRLDLTFNGAGDGGAAALAEHDWPLRRLRLHSEEVGPDGASALAGSGKFTVLDHFELSNNPLSDGGVSALAGGSFPALTSLNLFQTDCGTESLRAIAESSLPSHLRVLELGGNPVTADGIRLLFGPRWKELRSLNLLAATLSGEHPEALAKCAPSPKLHTLNLGSSRVGEHGLSALAGWRGLATLRRLAIHMGTVGPDGAAHLAASPHLDRLAVLHLFHNPLTPEGVAVLARGPWSRLRVLSLFRTGAGLEGVRALAASPRLSCLESLHLDSCDLSDDAAAVLSRASNWPRLLRLHLSHNAIGDAGAIRLAGSPLLRQLITLDLSANPITDTGAARLLASPYLHPRLFIDLRDAPIGPEMVERLRERFGDDVPSAF